MPNFTKASEGDDAGAELEIGGARRKLRIPSSPHFIPPQTPLDRATNCQVWHTIPYFEIEESVRKVVLSILDFGQ